MSNVYRLVLMAFVIGLLAIGCSQQPTQPSHLQNWNRSASMAIAVQSATLWVYVTVPGNQEVRVHRVTSPWSEATVTFNNFGGAYSPDVVGSFMSDGVGWRSVDVTTLVQAWSDGTYPNYGFLIEQSGSDLTWYFSSEGTDVATRPKLEICSPDCSTVQRGVSGTVFDALIVATQPDVTFGSHNELLTGLVGDLKKQSLLQFEVAVTPETAAIGDFVWNDLNMDGIQNEGEAGIPGVTVNLRNCAGDLLATIVTDVSGYYLFSGLTPGSYMVEFTLPSGYVFSPQNQGTDDGVDSDADVTTGRTVCTTLDAGETDLTWDAGMYTTPVVGCSYTIGYWKTHAGFGPQADVVTALLPIWLGTAGGGKSIQVTDAAMAVAILGQQTYGVPSNGITKLYAQHLGAKLNIAAGADGSAVATAIATADAFLATHDWHDWSGLSSSNKALVNSWKSLLDNYNNGVIGPGHCD